MMIRMLFSLCLTATALGLLASAAVLPDADPSTVTAFVPNAAVPCSSNVASSNSKTRTWFGVRPTAGAIATARGTESDGYGARSRSRAWLPRLACRGSEDSGMSMAATGGGPRIIIAGAPASGKGTQCSMIKEKYGVVHLSTGDMLRAAVQDETAVGLKAKGYMNEGKLVPDEVIIDIVKDRLAEDDCQSNGWLLDGFPRTRAQADALAAAGIKADSFLLLNVPDEELIARVIGRRLDPETGEIYHMQYNPPPEEIMSRVIQRDDDTAEKAKVRLETYHANIAAIKSCYEDITFSLDGAQPKGTVFDLIAAELESKISASAAAAKLRGGGEVGQVPTMPIEGMKPGTSGLRKKDEDA